MRNSQYFGLMWVLSAIAAAVIPSGTMSGVFVLFSVTGAGLAVYFLMKECGLLDSPDRAADDGAPRASVKKPVRGAAPRAGETPVESPLAWMARTIRSMKGRG